MPRAHRDPAALPGSSLQVDSHSEGAVTKPDLFSHWFENSAFWGQEEKEILFSGLAVGSCTAGLHTHTHTPGLRDPQAWTHSEAWEWRLVIRAPRLSSAQTPMLLAGFSQLSRLVSPLPLFSWCMVRGGCESVCRSETLASVSATLVAEW